MRRALPMLLALGVLLSALPAPASLAAPPAAIQGTVFVDANGQPVFALGANYAGPADRAWQMWADGLFEPALIAQDFARARAANLSVLRLFVHRPLADDVAAGRWTKLDRVLDLADQHELRLILTFADYGEAQVERLAAIAERVAARYRGRPTFFAYDLKNEPHFYDLATAIYPPGAAPRLQEPSIVAAVGERVPRDTIGEYRASEAGRVDIPARLSDEQAWVYANVLAAYRAFLDDAAAWARAQGATSVRYRQAPEAARWTPLLEALNDTVAAWLAPQLAAIRRVDPGRPITVGQVDPVIASLPANDRLDYRTLHRYPAASQAGIQAAMRVFDDVRAAIPDKPLVLGEFGFANDVLNEAQSAALEVEVVRAVRDRGGAGALKWMLNDFPQGFNPRENALGMYRGDGQPKAVVAAFQALGTLRPVVVSSGPPPVATPAPTPTPQPAPPAVRDARYFFETGYRIDNDTLYEVFQTRGRVETFGFPISRTFSFLGCPVQMFQRLILQLCPGQSPALINLLDPEIFPYTSVNQSVFPAPDEALKNRTPQVGTPSYAADILAFVHAVAPDTWEDEPVGFSATFFATGGLDIWGAPISEPMRDPSNHSFVYQRFQRGIMHYTRGQGTRGILLADYLKGLLLGPARAPAVILPPDLHAQADRELQLGSRAGRFLRQYCPGATNWVCDPGRLPATDLTFAFEPS